MDPGINVKGNKATVHAHFTDDEEKDDVELITSKVWAELAEKGYVEIPGHEGVWVNKKWQNYGIEDHEQTHSNVEEKQAETIFLERRRI